MHIIMHDTMHNCNHSYNLLILYDFRKYNALEHMTNNQDVTRNLQILQCIFNA